MRLMAVGEGRELDTQIERRLPPYVYSESMVGPDGAFLWYCIPKNASRSLLKMLRARSAKRILDLAGGVDPRAWLESRPLPAFTFAFVRHPYERLTSAWRNILAEPASQRALPALFDRMPGLVAGISVDEFVSWLAANYGNGGIDKHWRRQTDFICDEHGPCVDFVGRVESLRADLVAIEVRIGTLGRLAHKNRSTADAVAATTPLSSRSRAIIQEIYRSDFEAFGFEA